MHQIHFLLGSAPDPCLYLRGLLLRGWRETGEGEEKVKGEKGERWREGFGPPKHFGVAPPMTVPLCVRTVYSRVIVKYPRPRVLQSSPELCVRRPCSDFMDMLRRLINCRVIIIIIIRFELLASDLQTPNFPNVCYFPQT